MFKKCIHFKESLFIIITNVKFIGLSYIQVFTSSACYRTVNKLTTCYKNKEINQIL